MYNNIFNEKETKKNCKYIYEKSIFIKIFYADKVIGNFIILF